MGARYVAMETTRAQRILKRAATLFGEDELASRLRVPRHLLDAWICGHAPIPERKLLLLAGRIGEIRPPREVTLPGTPYPSGGATIAAPSGDPFGRQTAEIPVNCAKRPDHAARSRNAWPQEFAACERLFSRLRRSPQAARPSIISASKAGPSSRLSSTACRPTK